MSEVLVLTDEDVQSVLSMDDAINIVEEGFADDGRDLNVNFDVVRDRLPHKSEGIFGIKSGYMKRTEFLGLKAGGYWASNRGTDVLPHQSVMLLFDPETGVPVALVRANYITGVRTGAAGAVAAKYLARPDASCAGLIGCGAQGRMQLRGLRALFPLQKVVVWDAFPEAVDRLKVELASEIDIPIEVAADAREVAEQADIIVTTTPGGGPVLQDAWIREGQHINAIGADTAGKQELDTNILVRAKLVVDNLQQCMTLGETQHLKKLGIDAAQHHHARLGDIVCGSKPGRESDSEITVYDATGVTFQDLIAAGVAWQRCKEQGLGVRIRI